MGNLLLRLWSKFTRLDQARIIVLGLDAAGKTTLLYKLKLGEVVATIPTIGFNVEHVTYKKINFTVWDVCAQDKIRPLWRYYYENIQSVVYLIDSNDKERLPEAQEELTRILQEPLLAGLPLLLFCNKQDLPNAMTVEEIVEKLDLSLTDRPWKAQALSAASGKGLYEGFDWLADTLHKLH